MLTQKFVEAQNLAPSIPTDPADWRAWLATLDEVQRLALFAVEHGAVIFRCPTNGRQYLDEGAQTISGARWARCHWCDTEGRVRFVDADFNDRERQPHAYSIVGVGDD